MFKYVLLFCLTILFNGCTGKQLKETGGTFANANGLGVIIGAPIVVTRMIVERNEESSKEEERLKKLNTLKETIIINDNLIEHLKEDNIKETTK